MAWKSVSVLVLAACTRSPYVCPGAPGQDPELTGLFAFAPEDGGVLRGPWTPVLIGVTPRDRDSLVTTCLDGEHADDPLGLVREKRGDWGGGFDYVGLLDLTHVDPGGHELLVVFTRRGNRRAAARLAFDYDRPPHAVTLAVTGAGGPAWARVTVLDEDGARVPLVTVPPEADPGERDRTVRSVFAVDGVARLWLDPGTYRFLAVGSVLDDLGRAAVTVDGDTAVELQLTRQVELPGHLSADLHVHTGASYDSFLPDQLRYASLLAAGLDVVVVTDHRKVIDPGPALELVAPDHALRGVVGVEHHFREAAGEQRWLGHLNAFPVVDETEAALPGPSVDRVGEALGDFITRHERHPHPDVDEVVLQLNHPRGIHFFPERDPNRGAWSLFRVAGLDHDLPVGEGDNAWWVDADPATGASPLDFDAMEIVNRFSWELYLDVRKDWFWLLDQGVWLTGTGNSDSHALEVEVAGFPVNLVRAPRPAPGEPLDMRAFARALRDGDVLVTNGPVVELTVVSPAGPVLPGGRAEGQPLTALVRVRAASWVPVDEVRLVVGGEVVRQQVLDHLGTPLDVTYAWPIEVAGDSWVLAEAGWPLEFDGRQPTVGGDYGVVAPGYVPLGFTNPVRIDADGDGVWAP